MCIKNYYYYYYLSSPHMFSRLSTEEDGDFTVLRIRLGIEVGASVAGSGELRLQSGLRLRCSINPRLPLMETPQVWHILIEVNGG